MTPTKSQQAQEYAEKKYRKEINSLRLKPWCEVIPIAAQAYLDGYTACEQSMWRSVERNCRKMMKPY